MDLVVKDNNLINASYTLGLVEQRLILLAIIEARESASRIDTETYLEIHAQHYASRFNVDVKNTYAMLSDAVQTLFNRQVTYITIDTKRNKPEKRVVRWVSGISYVEGAGIVKLRFSPEVIPLVTQLEQNFTSYELEQVKNLNAYATRLYELLASWRSTGKTPIMAIQDFRAKIGVEVDEYKLMSDFKKRVFEPSIEQINAHTDITVSYEQHKAGRTITGFSFTFTQKKQPKDVTPKAKKSAAKPKTTKQEEQLDWMTADILDRFNSLSHDHQKLVVDQVETSLKGAKQARFKAARLSSIERLVADFALDINEVMMKNIQSPK